MRAKALTAAVALGLGLGPSSASRLPDLSPASQPSCVIADTELWPMRAAAAPARRSSLFIWHGAEERGLMGSRWYVKHPTVPLTSIVAVLNGDMMGRNDPTTAALLGALPPHRNSPELVAMAHAANGAVAKFTIDSSWDDPNHREGWYYRSDHLPYARSGVPALFFTTLLHADYHTPFDNPDRIDVAKLTKMTRWMYATGRMAAEADTRPALDPAFKLERCRDFTGNYC